MYPILILTKNLVLEQELQQRLQYLNYEVFCSAKLYARLSVSDYHEGTQMEELDQLLKNYQAVILSETISDNEIQEILPILKTKEWIILRKLTNEPSNKKEAQLKNSCFDGWIGTDWSIDVLREQLAEKLPNDPKEERGIVFLYSNKKYPGDIVKLRGRLTKREKMLLECLVEAKGEPVSREEICSKLWHTPTTNSSLSQSSVLVKRLKSKLEMAGYDPEIIQTVWGRGYYLTKNSINGFA